jgi:hypothetical protein
MRTTERPLTMTAIVLLMAVIPAGPSFAQSAAQPAQSAQSAQSKPVKTYSSAEDAANALAQAAKAQDESALEAILGAGPEVLKASDDNATQLNRRRFSEKYDRMHRLVREPDGSTVLYVGAENWPFPLTQKDGKWSFDTNAGLDELLYRTIGQNEMTALEICQMLADADAAAAPGMSGMSGMTSAKDKDAMRAHMQAVTAAKPSDADDDDQPLAFYGYYFQRMKAPSGASKSGARARKSGDKLEAVEFIAYPVGYRSSGVMTFLVTEDGVVYEKDLGPETPKSAPRVKSHKKGSGWAAVHSKAATATAASTTSRK